MLTELAALTSPFICLRRVCPVCFEANSGAISVANSVASPTVSAGAISGASPTVSAGANLICNKHNTIETFNKVDTYSSYGENKVELITQTARKGHSVSV